nr:transcription factor protein isoform X3 [Ciona intestinalis]|eukprot:XP_018672000.1 transcription factor protein isoform X3 [Ciona intestinalis]
MDRPPEGSFDPDCFSDIWNNQLSQQSEITSSQQIYTFNENTDGLTNSLTIDLLTEFQQFEQGPTSDANAGENQAGNTEKHDGNEGSYQCLSNFPTSNPPMRSYSNDMTQQNTINQHHPANMANLVTTSSHPINQHNLVYHSTSPNTGDAPNSTQNSPYAPSPCGGYEYPTSPLSSKPTIPPSTDYPGEWDFQINFGEATESAPKSAQYTYSPIINKLFVKMNVTCPIKFKCARPPPNGCVVRVMPVFKRPEHVTDIVTRCPNHKIPDQAQHIPHSQHLIRAEMPGENPAIYNVAMDGRENVAVMFERPQIGAEYTTVLYKFMCLSSCVGGINRRPLNAVFNLENAEGQVLGRRVVEVRVCSCPGRDRSQEEKRKRTAESEVKSGSKRTYKCMQGSMNIVQTAPAKRKCAMNGNDDQEEFTLKIRGRDKFEMLKKIKEALDLAEVAAHQQVENYRDEDARTRQSTSSAAPPREESSASTSRAGQASTSALCMTEHVSHGSQGFSLTPTHSSHPLTVTPTLEPPIVEGKTPYTHNTSAYPGMVDQSYWSTESDLGYDIPDTKQPTTTGNGLPNWPNQESLDSNPKLLRNISGLSSVSSLTSSQLSSQTAGRFVTRVTLRQTVALNPDMPNSQRWDHDTTSDNEDVTRNDVKREHDNVTNTDSFDFL